MVGTREVDNVHANLHVNNILKEKTRLVTFQICHTF